MFIIKQSIKNARASFGRASGNADAIASLCSRFTTEARRRLWSREDQRFELDARRSVTVYRKLAGSRRLVGIDRRMEYVASSVRSMSKRRPKAQSKLSRVLERTRLSRALHSIFTRYRTLFSSSFFLSLSLPPSLSLFLFLYLLLSLSLSFHIPPLGPPSRIRT